MIALFSRYDIIYMHRVMWRKHPSISNNSDSRAYAVLGKRRTEALLKVFRLESNERLHITPEQVERILRSNKFCPTEQQLEVARRRGSRATVDLEVCSGTFCRLSYAS
jgi:hypothetical protein